DEHVRGSTVGVSLAGMTRSAYALAGGDAPAWTDRFDAAFGWSQKTVRLDLTPGVSLNETDTHDFGVFLRACPLLLAPERVPTRLDVALGHARLNDIDDGTFGSHIERDEVALRFSSGTPRAWRSLR